MIGKIFITRSGYDPELGKHVKDPYLGKQPTFGACRPDIRRKVAPGDHIFVISGKVRGVPQFVMGGFEVEKKISAQQAFEWFPDQRLRLRPDGQITGNVIVDAAGGQHLLDTHNPAPKAIAQRLQNYVIGTNPIALTTTTEIARGRAETLGILSEILETTGRSPKEIVGRFGHQLTERQVRRIRDWLESLKEPRAASAREGR
jgi:hypothetical protein